MKLQSALLWHRHPELRENANPTCLWVVLTVQACCTMPRVARESVRLAWVLLLCSRAPALIFSGPNQTSSSRKRTCSESHAEPHALGRYTQTTAGTTRKHAAILRGIQLGVTRLDRCADSSRGLSTSTSSCHIGGIRRVCAHDTPNFARDCA